MSPASLWRCDGGTDLFRDDEGKCKDHCEALIEYALKAEELYVNYGEASILWDLSFEIPKGLLVGIVGPNGAGKSTLLKSALQLVRPFSGKISYSGKVAYVPQRESVDWDFPITAEEVVLMGRYGRLGLFGRPRRADLDAVALALEQVGMTPFAKRQIGELSGGQQQRLFIARALVQMADLIVLDEPFAGVDLTTEKAIMELLRKLKMQGKTILIVHHDLLSVEEYFDWVILLNTQLLGCGPVSQVFTKENLARAFGKGHTLFTEAANFAAKTQSGHI